MAACGAARATAGRIRALKAGQKPALQPGNPPAENQPRFIENSRISSMAIQKLGRATPTCVTPIRPVSTAVPLRLAAMTPMGRATSSDRTVAIRASGADTARRSAIRPPTGT
ncbi:hypothetical protein D3C73_1075210 [compost metagenome]